ncbi:MAG: histidine phosphatase family protein [Thermoflexales bacterium]|nr:histidine phosphatase family protein [Thermoflexales bacterium]MDW8352363.1 histidine phosphatase family protein [Anaerolineae bacterium]
MLKELYLIRHAQPQPNTGLAYDRVPGPPLSEIGRQEARATGLYLSQCGIERLFVSPLDRTQETARLIAEHTRAPMQIEEALAEHRSDESFESVKARVQDLLARVEAEPFTCVGFVTHGSPTKALLQTLSKGSLDLSRFIFDNGNHVPTAGVWRAERTEDGWRLELVFTPAMACAG